MRFLAVLVSVYRAWPWRPHCAPGAHVWGCRLGSRLLGGVNGYDDCVSCTPGDY